MKPEDRLLELIASSRRDLMPSMLSLREEDDLPMVLVIALQVLERRPEPTIKDLASYIGRSESRTSRLVAQLVNRGLAERVEDAADRRQKRVRVAPSGVAYLERIDEIRLDAQLKLWRHLSAEEQEALLMSWELIAKAARRLRNENDRTE